MVKKQKKPGSIWRRWEPHIHAPGTVFNDHFGGDDPWSEYLTKLEQAIPAIEALGVTDYFSLDVYEEVCAWKAKGRIPKIGLIFPNIEMRYAVGTSKGAPVNFHLLISPDDPDHVTKTRRFLEGLTFKMGDDTYRCRRDDIILLGKAHSGKELSNNTAFREGANQFKVEVDSFIEAWSDNPWIQKNALIAIAASSKDGAAGLQGDASLAALRRKIERKAHIIFSSQPNQREFWLGRGVLPAKELIKTYGSLKPCLHGSDAHHMEKVAKPDKDRFCWIKGDPCFESLRQACMEPELRAIVSEDAPSGAFASQTISSISMENAEWFGAESIVLNSGLVGVIGARGSGKTALADMIAAGAYALSSHVNERSFVRRAESHLKGAKAVLHWRDGSHTNNEIDTIDLEDIFDTPRVQYLSQQFVEQLCSAEGATDDLIAEIERVIFTSHHKEERLGAENFRELLALTAARGREARKRHEDAIAGIGGKIAKQRDKQDGLVANKVRLKELDETNKKDKLDRAKLVPKGAEAHAKEFDIVSSAADVIRGQIEQAKRRGQALDLLADHVNDFRKRIADSELEDLKTRHIACEIVNNDWLAFKTKFTGNVDAIIKDSKLSIARLIAQLQGTKEDYLTEDKKEPSSENSVLPKGVDLASLPLLLLTKEEERLRKLIGVDEGKRKRHAQISEKIRTTETKIKNINEAIIAAEAAEAEIKRLVELRTTSYEGVFEGIVSEEAALQKLYQPLSDRLSDAEGALENLTFSVKRIVDIDSWARRGEELIDTRKAGTFKGRGALLEAVEAELGESWRTGTAKDVAAAMSAFRDSHNETIIQGAKADRKNKPEWRAWGAQVSEWLYSTEHIRIAYGMRYEGVEIETLSPGTRGIVLLLLYLAIDTEDDRPLIIDQPEENLDPKSIFDELVGLFRTAKLRRQIIIVTHNANLIVNTDADQVIVAECGPIESGKLPKITYTSGALEDSLIRKHVCDILEGGEQAFRERAQRLRVSLG
ncbi:MAG: TrlF family AAA-like ATPase [Candidatus Thiodiazotropha taylori]